MLWSSRRSRPRGRRSSFWSWPPEAHAAQAAMIALLWTARPIDEGADRLDHAWRGVLEQRRVVAARDHDPLPIGRAEPREQPRLRVGLGPRIELGLDQQHGDVHG